MDESSIIDMDHTEIIIIKGSQLQEEVRLEQLMPEGEKSNCYLCTSGIFMLYEKYFTLNQLKFTNPNDQSQIKGENIGEHLKTKNQNLALYNAFLLIVMTKNLKLLYLNLDSLLLIGDSNDEDEIKKYSELTVYDKIYGQQSFLLCSKMIIVDQKVHKFLQCLGEYKYNYVQQNLDAVFQKDLILQTMLSLRGTNKKKLLPKELTSDLEIHCSLSYGMN